MRPMTTLVELLPPSMRNRLKQASLLVFAGIVLGFIAAPAATGQAATTIRRVTILPGNGDLRVEISASQPVTPQTMVITGPDRLVIDFPNALPGPDLHSQQINRGKVKGIRVGLFTARPPVTRVVVDLEQPQPYQIVPSGSSVLVKLNTGSSQRADSPLAHLGAAAAPLSPAQTTVPLHRVVTPHVPRAIPATSFSVVRVPVSATASAATPYEPPRPSVAQQGMAFPSTGMTASVPPMRRGSMPTTAPPASGAIMPARAGLNPNPISAPMAVAAHMEVDFRNGKLKIVADHATLASVLNEVHRQMGTQISLPAGGGMEQVYVSLGPAAPREVMAALLNGSHFNFIIVGNDSDPSRLSSVILTPSSGPADAPAPYSPPLAAQAPEYTPPTTPDVATPPAEEPPPDDSANAGPAPDGGEDANANPEQPETVPRHPRSHRPPPESAEQPQDQQQ